LESNFGRVGKGLFFEVAFGVFRTQKVCDRANNSRRKGHTVRPDDVTCLHIISVCCAIAAIEDIKIFRYRIFTQFA
ncbi:hypothetical protein, partial [uncultured Parasphingorhabdus sp.]|uniref:hypothetical protein n=1 Tax=uncultured Parasphingorhabdus sp. TaxID=2709694 RepID=UPI0030D8AE4E